MNYASGKCSSSLPANTDSSDIYDMVNDGNAVSIHPVSLTPSPALRVPEVLSVSQLSGGKGGGVTPGHQFITHTGTRNQSHSHSLLQSSWRSLWCEKVGEPGQNPQADQENIKLHIERPWVWESNPQPQRCTTVSPVANPNTQLSGWIINEHFLDVLIK